MKFSDIHKRVKEINKMSGCHDSEDKNVFYLVKQIQELEKRLNCIEHLIEHSHDGIEKCFDKIEEVESLAKKYPPENRYGTLKDILCRIEQLENHKNYQIDENRKSSKRIDDIIKIMVQADCKLENDLIKLDISIKNVEKLFYDELHRIRERDKKPYKCPVCDGTGSAYFANIKDCHVCEGKGIIWG